MCYPGINLSDFQRPIVKSSYPSLIYLGRLKPYKNVDIAIKAFAKVSEKFPRAVFHVAGDGESMISLKLLVQNLNLTGKVIFHGRVSEKKKMELLTKAWLAIQPSSFEGWGITVLEANACGTPVIAAKVNGLIDSVRNPYNGVLVPVNNVSAFIEQIINLYSHSKLRQKMSRNALKWAKQYNWQKSASQFMQVIVKNYN